MENRTVRVPEEGCTDRPLREEPQGSEGPLARSPKPIVKPDRRGWTRNLGLAKMKSGTSARTINFMIEGGLRLPCHPTPSGRGSGVAGTD